MLRTLAVASVVLLSACAVGPDYQRPEVSGPASFIRAEPTLFSQADPDAEFWRRFDDLVLMRLVDDALAANHDLRIALARHARARSLLRQARQDRLPAGFVSAEVANQQSSADQMPGVSRSDRESDSFAAAVGAIWEPDLFGRLRRSVEAQKAALGASAADVAAVQVAVVAELVRNYFELRGLQEQLRVAKANAANQRESFELVQARLAVGRGTRLDAMRAAAQLESTLSRIPALEGEIVAATHRIAVLTGRQPDALVAELQAPRVLPALPAQVAVGLPADLLRRRPDVIAAERRVAAATARVGIATADLYPRFTLTGLIGTQAADVGDLFGRDSETRLVALGVDWSFLQIGRVRAGIAAANADVDADVALYEQTVLRALEEAETALARYSQALRQRAHLREAAVAAAEGARLARQRYDSGVIDFLQVIDAERAQLEIEDRLAVSDARSATALVEVYRVLAGGWSDRGIVGEGVAGR